MDNPSLWKGLEGAPSPHHGAVCLRGWARILGVCGSQLDPGAALSLEQREQCGSPSQPGRVCDRSTWWHCHLGLSQSQLLLRCPPGLLSLFQAVHGNQRDLGSGMVWAGGR